MIVWARRWCWGQSELEGSGVKRLRFDSGLAPKAKRCFDNIENRSHILIDPYFGSPATDLTSRQADDQTPCLINEELCTMD